MGIAAAVSGYAQEDYINLGGERIFVRVESHPFPSFQRGSIVLAEAPPRFGSPGTHGWKWRAE